MNQWRFKGHSGSLKNILINLTILSAFSPSWARRNNHVKKHIIKPRTMRFHLHLVGSSHSHEGGLSLQPQQPRPCWHCTSYLRTECSPLRCSQTTPAPGTLCQSEIVGTARWLYETADRRSTENKKSDISDDWIKLILRSVRRISGSVHIPLSLRWGRRTFPRVGHLCSSHNRCSRQTPKSDQASPTQPGR